MSSLNSVCLHDYVISKFMALKSALIGKHPGQMIQSTQLRFIRKPQKIIWIVYIAL